MVSPSNRTPDKPIDSATMSSEVIGESQDP
jgi:hypothetical protein